MAPSKLAVATSSVLRLVKEEASYHKEITQQEERIKTLETNPDGENAEYILRQEKQALQETKNVLLCVQEKIGSALEKLEDLLEESKEAGGEASIEEITKAKEAMLQGKTALRESK